MKKTLTAARAKELLRYDPETGLLYWRTQRGSRKAGAPAGCFDWISGTQYRTLMVDRVKYMSHRMVWFLEYGYWPNVIDHIDGDGTNNKLENLRDVDHRTNGRNRIKCNRNTSGVTGVTRSRDLWQATIRDQDGKDVFLGRFEHLKAARRARKEAEKRWGYTDRHGL